MFDSVEQTYDVEVGEMSDEGMVETGTTASLNMVIDLSVSNHVDGGHLMVSGSSKKDAQDRPTNIKATVSGVIHTTVIENGVSKSKDIVIPKGKLITGSKLSEFKD